MPLSAASTVSMGWPIPSAARRPRKLFARIRAGGRFGYASVFPAEAPSKNPSVEVTRVFAKPDPAKVREFADDIRDGKFVLPISQRLPLSEVAKAHAMLEKGGGGKIVIVI